jgi:uncharacterized protein
MASQRPFDPRRLGVEAFARDGATLEGREPFAAFPRLAASASPEAPDDRAHPVVWRAHGEMRRPQSIEPQIWLHLEANAAMALVCQRCLAPVETPLEVDRWFRFTRTEQEAAALDEQIEEDVLSLERPLDLHDLVEDELLLTMPLVPRHEVCPEPLPMPHDEAPRSAPPPHPFGVLSALKGARDDGDG